MMMQMFFMCSSVLAPAIGFWQRLKGWFAEQKIGFIYFAAGVILSIVMAGVVSYLFRRVLKRLIKRTETEFDDMLIDALHRPVVMALVVTGVMFSLRFLHLGNRLPVLINKAYFLLMISSVVWALLRMVNVLRGFLTALAKKTENSFDDLLVGLLCPAIKTVIWVFALLFVADNVFNFNVTTLLAGAGVAAMAIAFAAQNTIANLFGALSLIADHPFVIGDTVVVNGRRGVVTSIGLRSCRLRSLDGTEWIITNKEIAEAAIENISKRPNIKQVFDIGVVYSTTPDELARGVEIVKEIFAAHPLTDMENMPPTVSFESMRDSSLNIQAVHRFNTSNYGEFVKAREEINFAILRRFNEAGLEMAYPTQTLYIAGGQDKPLNAVNPEDKLQQER